MAEHDLGRFHLSFFSLRLTPNDLLGGIWDDFVVGRRNPSIGQPSQSTRSGAGD